MRLELKYIFRNFGGGGGNRPLAAGRGESDAR